MDRNSSEDEGSQAATTTQRTASVQSSVASSVLPLTALARSKYGNFEEKSKRKGGVPLVSKTVTDPDSFAAVGGVPEHVAALRRELQRGDDDLVARGLAPPPVAPGAKQMTKAAIARKAAVATRSGRAQKAAAAPEVEQKPQAAVLKGLDPGEEARRQRIAYRMKFFNDPRVVSQLEEAAAKGQKKTGASRSSSAAGGAQPAGRGLSRSASTVTSKSQGGGVRETKASQLRRGASFASKPSSSVGGDGDAMSSYDGARRDTFMRATSFASNKHQREASKERSRSAGRTRGGGADGTSEVGASTFGGGGGDDDGDAWETRSAAAGAARTTRHGSPSPRRGQPPQPTRNIFGGNNAIGECPTSYVTCVQSNLSASAAWVSAQCR